MSMSGIEHSKLLDERANLIQVRRYIDSYMDIFKDYERNIRTFIKDVTEIILPRLEKGGYYKFDQYTVSDFQELKSALFEYSQESDLSDLKRQIGKMNELISQQTLRKLYGKDYQANDTQNIYDLRETVQNRINQIDYQLKSSVNENRMNDDQNQSAA